MPIPSHGEPIPLALPNTTLDGLDYSTAPDPGMRFHYGPGLGVPALAALTHEDLPLLHNAQNSAIFSDRSSTKVSYYILVRLQTLSPPLCGLSNISIVARLSQIPEGKERQAESRTYRCTNGCSTDRRGRQRFHCGNVYWPSSACPWH